MKRLRPSKKIIILIPLILVTVLIIFPNRVGILKATGFWEADFIPSTSNALFETNKALGFIARIGDSQNPNIPTLSLNLGSDVKFTLAEPVKQSPPQATDSGSLEISEQITQLETLVSEVSADVSKITGETSRSFFGPYESINQNGYDNGPITYYINNNSLIQTWKQISNNNEINFLTNNPEYSIIITKNQDWIITKDNKNYIKITTQINSKNGSPVNLPEIKENLYPTAESQVLTLTLPEELSKNYEDNFPITITRIISVFDNNSSALPEYINETLNSGIEPVFVTSYKDNYVFFDKGDKTLKFNQNQTPINILTDVNITGISCIENKCVATDQLNIYTFTPEETSSENPPTKYQPGYPIGGSFLTPNYLYITDNSSPIGKLIRIKNDGSSEVLVSDLAYSETIYFATNEQVLFWANGQLNKFKNSLEVVNIPSKPISATFDEFDNIYLVSDYQKAKTKVILKISPNNLVEIASKLTAQFTSISLNNDNIILGLIVPNYSGVIWPIAYSKIAWLPVADFMQQY